MSSFEQHRKRQQKEAKEAWQYMPLEQRGALRKLGFNGPVDDSHELSKQEEDFDDELGFNDGGGVANRSRRIQN